MEEKEVNDESKYLNLDAGCDQNTKTSDVSQPEKCDNPTSQKIPSRETLFMDDTFLGNIVVVGKVEASKLNGECFVLIMEGRNFSRASKRRPLFEAEDIFKVHNDNVAIKDFNCDEKVWCFIKTFISLSNQFATHPQTRCILEEYSAQEQIQILYLARRFQFQPLIDLLTSAIRTRAKISPTYIMQSWFNCALKNINTPEIESFILECTQEK